MIVLNEQPKADEFEDSKQKKISYAKYKSEELRHLMRVLVLSDRRSVQNSELLMQSFKQKIFNRNKFKKIV